MMAHLKHIYHEIGIIYTDLLIIQPNEEEVNAQEQTHCNYMKAVGEAYEKAEQYFFPRKDEADSVAPINIPDVEQRNWKQPRKGEMRSELERRKLREF